MDPLLLIVIVLIVCYAAGLGTYGLMAGGGLIHVLLVVVVIVILVRLMRGQSI